MAAQVSDTNRYDAWPRRWCFCVETDNSHEINQVKTFVWNSNVDSVWSVIIVFCCSKILFLCRNVGWVRAVEYLHPFGKGGMPNWRYLFRSAGMNRRRNFKISSIKFKDRSKRACEKAKAKWLLKSICITSVSNLFTKDKEKSKIFLGIHHSVPLYTAIGKAMSGYYPNIGVVTSYLLA